MKENLKKTGYTLVEMLIVVGVIAALVGVGLPAIRSLFQSFEWPQESSVTSASGSRRPLIPTTRLIPSPSHST
ncbi:MAG: pilus assembly FimT family protein [Planctomycetota bacterium]